MQRRIPIEDFNKRLKDLGSYLQLIEYMPETVYVGLTKRTVGRFSCKCGNVVTLPITKIKFKRQLSCGCRRNESEKNSKYKSYDDRLRRAYYTMINRCYNPNDGVYKWYGAEGVIVCKEWLENGQSFFDWAIQYWKPGLQIDKDIIPKRLGIPAKLYSPEMCCWVTRIENMRNRRNSITLPYKGGGISVNELATKLGCSFEYIKRQIRLGEKSADRIEEIYLNDTRRILKKNRKNN